MKNSSHSNDELPRWVHIGLPKCASTSIQSYLRRNGIKCSILDWYHMKVFCAALEVNNNYILTRAFELLPVRFSFEDILGFDPSKWLNRMEILTSQFPKVKFLIVFRDPRSLYESIRYQNLFNGNFRSEMNYENFTEIYNLLAEYSKLSETIEVIQLHDLDAMAVNQFFDSVLSGELPKKHLTNKKVSLNNIRMLNQRLGHVQKIFSKNFIDALFDKIMLLRASVVLNNLVFAYSLFALVRAANFVNQRKLNYAKRMVKNTE